jgi:hypothetical protein
MMRTTSAPTSAGRTIRARASSAVVVAVVSIQRLAEQARGKGPVDDPPPIRFMRIGATSRARLVIGGALPP